MLVRFHLALLAAVGLALATAALEERRRQRLAARGVAALHDVGLLAEGPCLFGHRRGQYGVVTQAPLPRSGWPFERFRS